jgi:hypothetical protein
MIAKFVPLDLKRNIDTLEPHTDRHTDTHTHVVRQKEILSVKYRARRPSFTNCVFSLYLSSFVLGDVHRSVYWK